LKNHKGTQAEKIKENCKSAMRMMAIKTAQVWGADYGERRKRCWLSGLRINTNVSFLYPP
jgi:hypothetical protein